MVTAGSIELRFGTRGSALALAQTDIVTSLLAKRHPNVVATRIVIQTEGDVDKSTPLSKIGGRGVFTSAIEDALRRGEIDAAVHSAKDLPTLISPEFILVAFPDRADPRDVVVSRHGCALSELPSNPVIASSSKRRAVQILKSRPDAKVVDLRGNVDTRLRKAFESDLDAVVLAAAGIARMGWHDKISEYLQVDSFVPSPGQGALALEIASNDIRTALLLADLDDPKVGRAVLIERAFLRAIGAGCTMPVGAFASFESGEIRLMAMVANDDGSRIEFANELLSVASAEGEAAELARRMAKSVGVSFVFVSGLVSEPNLPLRNQRVLITRTVEDAIEFADALIAVGAQPIVLPTLQIQDVTDNGSLDQAVKELANGKYDWIVFTSRHAVDRVLSRLDVPVTFPSTKIAVVGASTAGRLAKFGVSPDLIPKRSTATGLVEALSAFGVDGNRILFPHGDLAPDTIVRGLSGAGASVDAVVVYLTEPQTRCPPEIIEKLRNNEIDVITFMSPSSVVGLTSILEGNSLPFPRSIVACIGPVTAATARDSGIRVDVISSESSAQGLVKALIELVGKRAGLVQPAGS